MEDKSNITLIGMPGAGKSTVGIILAKMMNLGFIDTDILIQINQQKTLQQIVDISGHMKLRQIEEREICKVNIHNHVIATGGSAAYSGKAMLHLAKNSIIIFLEVDYDELLNRIKNFESRGIAKSKGQTFRELFDERQALYNRYADIIIDSSHINQEEVAELIKSRLSNIK